MDEDDTFRALTKLTFPEAAEKYLEFIASRLNYTTDDIVAFWESIGWGPSEFYDRILNGMIV